MVRSGTAQRLESTPKNPTKNQNTKKVVKEATQIKTTLGKLKSHALHTNNQQ